MVSSVDKAIGPRYELSMAEKLQPVRGTQDLLAADCRAFRTVDETAWKIAQRFGYDEIRTPAFEFSEVFHRTLGETSDVVSKETYKVVGPTNEIGRAHV